MKQRIVYAVSGGAYACGAGRGRTAASRRRPWAPTCCRPMKFSPSCARPVSIRSAGRCAAAPNYVLRAIGRDDRRGARAWSMPGTATSSGSTPVVTASRLPPARPWRPYERMRLYEPAPPDDTIAPGPPVRLRARHRRSSTRTTSRRRTCPRPPALGATARRRESAPLPPPVIAATPRAAPAPGREPRDITSIEPGDGLLPPPPERFPQRVPPPTAAKPKPVKRAVAAIPKVAAAAEAAAAEQHRRRSRCRPVRRSPRDKPADRRSCRTETIAFAQNESAPKVGALFHFARCVDQGPKDPGLDFCRCVSSSTAFASRSLADGFQLVHQLPAGGGEVRAPSALPSGQRYRRPIHPPRGGRCSQCECTGRRSRSDILLFAIHQSLAFAALR